MTLTANRRGLTLLEIAISTALLAGMAVVLLSALIPLQTASTSSSRSIDMDTKGRRVLSEIRRDVRVSGYSLTGGGTLCCAVVPGASPGIDDGIQFRQRTGPDEVFEDDNDPATHGWSRPIAYRTVADGTFGGGPGAAPRYRLVRDDGLTQVELATGFQAVSFALTPAASSGAAASLTITLTLASRELGPGGAGVLEPRHYTDVVQLLNRKSR